MKNSESKYYNTALLMDEALLFLLEKKDFEFITIKEICAKAVDVNAYGYLVLEKENGEKIEAELKELVFTHRKI